MAVVVIVVVIFVVVVVVQGIDVYGLGLGAAAVFVPVPAVAMARPGWFQTQDVSRRKARNKFQCCCGMAILLWGGQRELCFHPTSRRVAQAQQD